MTAPMPPVPNVPAAPSAPVGVPRPAGTTALLFTVLSLVMAVVLYGLGVGLRWVAPVWLWAPLVTAGVVAGVSAVVALVVGIVKRLAGQSVEVPVLGRVFRRALIGPAIAIGLWALLRLVSWVGSLFS